MPLYEYGCPKCGHVADVRHGFDDKPEVACEKCSAGMTRRFSAAPIVFKGSGFYVTDSRGSNSSNKSEKSESTEKPSEKSEPAKSEPAKSETKPEPKKDAAA